SLDFPVSFLPPKGAFDLTFGTQIPSEILHESQLLNLGMVFCHFWRAWQGEILIFKIILGELSEDSCLGTEVFGRKPSRNRGIDLSKTTEGLSESSLQLLPKLGFRSQMDASSDGFISKKCTRTAELQLHIIYPFDRQNRQISLSMRRTV